MRRQFIERQLAFWQDLLRGLESTRGELESDISYAKERVAYFANELKLKGPA